MPSSWKVRSCLVLFAQKGIKYSLSSHVFFNSFFTLLLIRLEKLGTSCFSLEPYFFHSFLSGHRKVNNSLNFRVFLVLVLVFTLSFRYPNPSTRIRPVDCKINREVGNCYLLGCRLLGYWFLYSYANWTGRIFNNYNSTGGLSFLLLLPFFWSALGFKLTTWVFTISTPSCSQGVFSENYVTYNIELFE